jgi:thermitase
MTGTQKSLLVMIMTVMFLTSLDFALATPAGMPEHVRNELLVTPADGVTADDLKELYQSKGGSLKKVVYGLGVHQITVPEQALEAIETALRHHPKIKSVEKNPLGHLASVPNDPIFVNQWHLSRIGAPLAWDVTLGSSNVPIAILDSGFVLSANVDLSGKTLPGYNATNGSSNISPNMACGNWEHGTHMAATAAGQGNNAFGGAGVAWQNPIIPVVVIESNCGLNVANTAAGIMWAVDHGAKVISASWYFYWSGPPTALVNAINYAVSKGVVFVSAAGNDAVQYRDPYGNIQYPQTLPNVLTVSATNSNDQFMTTFSSPFPTINPLTGRAYGSNYGTNTSLAAPGWAIYTTGSEGTTEVGYGTSFSAPIVAGAVALARSANPLLTALQINDIMKSSADDLGAIGFDPYYGYGRVNASKAVAMAIQTLPPVDPGADVTAPSAAILSGSASSQTIKRGKKYVTTYTANLSWTASTDNIGVASYSLYRNGAVLATGLTSRSYQDQSVTHGTSYSYTVFAVDAAGNRSVASNSVILVP